MRVRFHIRDLLWLALVVAVCVAWYVDRSRIARDAQTKLDAAANDYKMLKGYYVDWKVAGLKAQGELEQLRTQRDASKTSVPDHLP